MRVTECESNTHFSKAGAGRDRMWIGNATGWSICILQPVLLAKAGINEFCPVSVSGAPGSHPQLTVHHILKSMECL